VLHNLEANELDREGVPRIAGEGARPEGEERQILLFAESEDPVREALKACRPEEMTPLQALGMLSELKRKVEDPRS
jgi:hypothetical protein